MAEGVRPHHVALCALLRLYLDPAALVARLTPEMYQHVGTVLLGEIRQSTSINLPSLPELLIDLEVPPRRAGLEYVPSSLHIARATSARIAEASIPR